MRGLANGLAWGVLVLLAGAAILAVNRLGAGGLVVLGLLTWFVCVRAAMNEDVPTWSMPVLRDRMTKPATRETAGSDLVFFRRCGMGLTLAGVLLFVWERFP